jgi:hypothetical protein
MWHELTIALKRTFDVVREGEDWLGIIRDAIPLRVERGDVYGESWLLVLVDVCASTQMDYEEALERNVELAVARTRSKASASCCAPPNRSQPAPSRRLS